MKHATQGGHAGGISMDKELSIFYQQCKMESNGLNPGKKENVTIHCIPNKQGSEFTHNCLHINTNLFQFTRNEDK
jgi:hypothetical protein